MRKSITEEILGSSAFVKILDCFMEGRGLDYAISDLAEASNVSRQYAYTVVKNLMKFGIIEETRIVGRTQLYKIVSKNAIAKALLNFQDELLKYQIKRIEEENK